MACNHCPDHSSIQTMEDLHEKRLDSNDIEHGQIKESMKLKVSRWVFIVVIGLFGSGLGFQIATLSKVSETVNSIDKKVAVLYDREERTPESPSKKKANINISKVESCLILAKNQKQYGKL